MHVHYVEDTNGELTDTVALCSDSCHREYDALTGETYEGWSGCHEGPDYSEYCAACGVIVATGENACECQQTNVIVNRFLSDDGEACEHGNWIQLPASMLDERVTA